MYKYRKLKKSKAEERADRIAELAERIGLAQSAMEGGALPPATTPLALPATKVPFSDPDPFRTVAFPDVVAAKRAIADEIGMALAKLSPEDRGHIDGLLRQSLAKDHVIGGVRAYFRTKPGGNERC